jgi:UDP-glucose 4-epimerase
MIGSTIADLLVREDVREIVIVDNLSRGRVENLDWARANGSVTMIAGDVRDRALVTQVMRGVDVVFHQAAIRITQGAERPRLALEVLADGTFNVLEAAVAAGVKKVIAASSASVYGSAERFPTPEDHHPYGNRTLYGAAKLFGETMLRSFNDMYGLDYVALRYFNVYGPRMDAHGVYTEVLVRWMERIAACQPPIILGTGRQTMDFVYVADVARANILAARSEATDRAVNIASGVETSLNELACTLLRVMGSGLLPEHEPERKVNSVPRRLAETAVARRLIGFEASVPLSEGLEQLLAWWSRQNERREASVS